MALCHILSRLATGSAAILTLMLQGSLEIRQPALAELATNSGKPRQVCRPFRGEGGFAAVRNITPRIRVGDTIEYVSYGEIMDSLSFLDRGYSNANADGLNKIKVAANGYIYMPNTGMLQVVGLTIPELREKMRNALKKHYRNPTLTIYQVQQGTIRVTISGQVRSPGTFQLGTPIGDVKEDSAYRQRPNTVEEVIVRAGGLLSTADFDNVEVYTRDGNCFTVSLDITQSGRSRNGAMALDDGDSLIVRTVPEIDFNSERFKLMARSDLASTKQRILVLGDVLKPGVVETNWLTTPLEVIAIAGGPTSTAAKDAFLAQPNVDSRSYKYRVFPIHVRSNEFLTGFNGQLTEGSIIYVGKSTLANFQQIVRGFFVPAATAVGVSGAIR